MDMVVVVGLGCLVLGFLAGVAFVQSRGVATAGEGLHALRAQVSGMAEHLRAVAEANRRWDEWLLDGNRRGALAEQQAENLLRAAGLQADLDYVRQRALPSGAQPDLTLLLPRGRVLHLDAKFPLPAFRRYAEADEEADRRRHRAEFVRAVAGHVQDVLLRGYADDPDGLGFVLLYLPYDRALDLLGDGAGGLERAVAHPKVVLCSPATLRPLLDLLERTLDAVMVERNVDEIVAVLDGVQGRWDEFVAAGGGLDTLTRHLTNAHNTLYGEVARRRGEISRQLSHVQQLRRLGASVRAGG
jgi:DNA anti-recombination protein RmuC